MIKIRFQRSPSWSTVVSPKLTISDKVSNSISQFSLKRNRCLVFLFKKLILLSNFFQWLILRMGQFLLKFRFVSSRSEHGLFANSAGMNQRAFKGFKSRNNFEFLSSLSSFFIKLDMFHSRVLLRNFNDEHLPGKR